MVSILTVEFIAGAAFGFALGVFTEKLRQLRAAQRRRCG